MMLGMPDYNKTADELKVLLERGVVALENLASAAKGMGKALSALAETAREQHEMTAKVYGYGPKKPEVNVATGYICSGCKKGVASYPAGKCEDCKRVAGPPVDEALMAQQDAQYATLPVRKRCTRCGAKEKALGSTMCKACMDHRAAMRGSG